MPPTIILSPLPFILSLSKDRAPDHHHPKPPTIILGLSKD